MLFVSRMKCPRDSHPLCPVAAQVSGDPALRAIQAEHPPKGGVIRKRRRNIGAAAAGTDRRGLAVEARGAQFMKSECPRAANVGKPIPIANHLPEGIRE